MKSARSAWRRLVDVARRADLQDVAFAHHRDARSHRHRLFLVVGDHHAGHADFLDDVDELDLGFFAQLLVERAERLVEQQQLRPLGQAACERDALLLASRQLMGLALGELAELHELEHGLDALGDPVLGHAFALQSERDVLPHRQVREERIRLEHHVDRAVVGRDVGEVAAVEHDAPRGRRLEAREHAQQGRLAAAGGADQREDLALGDVQVDVIHGLVAAEILDHVLDLQKGCCVRCLRMVVGRHGPSLHARQLPPARRRASVASARSPVSETGLERGVQARHRAPDVIAQRVGHGHLLHVGRAHEHGRVVGDLGLDELLRFLVRIGRRRPCS